MKNRNQNSFSNGGENPSPQKGNPMQPEITPQQPQPGRDKPEIQQPGKELPEHGHPDEVNYPSTKPNIKQPKTENANSKQLLNQF